MLKAILKDADEITDFIVTHSPYNVDEGLIREYYDRCRGVLKTISVCSLIEGDANQNLANKKKVIFYCKLPIETMPPLIVEDGVINDGNHRFRALKRNKIEQVKIYDIISY